MESISPDVITLPSSTTTTTTIPTTPNDDEGALN
jgi:hypothetical protein